MLLHLPSLCFGRLSTFFSESLFLDPISSLSSCINELMRSRAVSIHAQEEACRKGHNYPFLLLLSPSVLSCLPRLFTPLPRSPEISPSILFHFLTTGVPQIATLGKSRSVDLISHPISVGSEAIKMATPTSSSYPDLSPSVIADPDLYCTLSTCPLSLATVEYRPSLAGNALYLALFGLFLAAQLFFGIRHRTWGFLVGMIGGNVLEVVGYAGRIQMYHDPFSDDAFRLCVLSSLPTLQHPSAGATVAVH